MMLVTHLALASGRSSVPEQTKDRVLDASRVVDGKAGPDGREDRVVRVL
jgi:hypothetical protein